MNMSFYMSILDSQPLSSPSCTALIFPLTINNVYMSNKANSRGCSRHKLSTVPGGTGPQILQKQYGRCFLILL